MYKAVGAGQHAVVEVPRVVAGRVLAVLGELDAEALVGAGVQTGDEALDHAPGDHREVLDAGQGLRFEVAVAGLRRHGCNWNHYVKPRTPFSCAASPIGDSRRRWAVRRWRR